MQEANLAKYAFISIGANLPHGSSKPVETLRAVVPALQELSSAPILLSSFFESDPKDCPPNSPLYINAVVGLLPMANETPESLLTKLQQVENAGGRVRTGIVNEARTLDLDLLSFGDEVRATRFLTLPHPRAHERRFVLEPWIELVGKDYKHNNASLQHWLSVNKDPELRRIKK